MIADRRHTIYGLRVSGDREVRYIGLTNCPVEERLAGHLSAAARRRHNLPLCDWLQFHGERVEIFKIGYAETRTEAQSLERALIGIATGLGQRLFNQRCVPVDLKEAA